jgi:hypothetical protein
MVILSFNTDTSIHSLHFFPKRRLSQGINRCILHALLFYSKKSDKDHILKKSDATTQYLHLRMSEDHANRALYTENATPINKELGTWHTPRHPLDEMRELIQVRSLASTSCAHYRSRLRHQTVSIFMVKMRMKVTNLPLTPP